MVNTLQNEVKALITQAAQQPIEWMDNGKSRAQGLVRIPIPAGQEPPSRCAETLFTHLLCKTMQGGRATTTFNDSPKNGESDKTLLIKVGSSRRKPEDEREKLPEKQMQEALRSTFKQLEEGWDKPRFKKECHFKGEAASLVASLAYNISDEPIIYNRDDLTLSRDLADTICGILHINTSDRAV